MPRYVNEDILLFTDADGNKVNYVDLQEIETDVVTVMDIELKESDELDEISQRSNIYSEGAEYLWYRIFDANAIPIVENDYSIKGLRKLSIPG